jgi:hypothetical protein
MERHLLCSLLDGGRTRQNTCEDTQQKTSTLAHMTSLSLSLSRASFSEATGCPCINTTERECNPNVPSKLLDQVEEPEEKKGKGTDFKRNEWHGKSQEGESNLDKNLSIFDEQLF